MSDGRYNFCNIGQDSFSIQCENNYVKKMSIKPISNIAFDPKDIACLSNIESIIFYNPYGSSIGDLISYSSYSSIKLGTMSFQNIDSEISGSPLLLAKVNKYLLSLTISIDQTTPIDIKFSYFSTLRYLTIKSNKNSTEYFPVSYTNDLTSLITPLRFEIAANTFPNLKFIRTTLDNVLVTLVSGYNKTSLNENIKTMTSLNFVSIFGVEGDLSPFPSNIKSLVSSNINQMNFYMNFEKPTAIIDISTKTNAALLKTLRFNNVGKDFNFNGGIPLKFRADIEGIDFENGDITTFSIRDFFSTYKYLYWLNFNFNNWAGPLGTWDKNFVSQHQAHYVSLDLSNNKITGTIDDSFCNLSQLNVRNNLLSGEIPTCFTCFFDENTLLKSYFSSNLFTNFNNYPPCTTIIPNIIRDSSKSDTFRSWFYIFGKDLGGVFSKPKIKDPLTGKEFEVTCLQGNFFWFVISTYENDNFIPLPTYLELTFTGNSRLNKYTLPTLPTPPKLQFASTDSLGRDFIFEGSFMTYNISTISIQVNGENCVPTSSPTFNIIYCSLSTGITSSLSQLAIVRVGSVASQITMITKKNNTLIGCPSDCNYFTGNGYCDSQLGTCVCNQNFQGADCLISYKDCPIYAGKVCNGGSCNTQTGECSCDTTHQGSDCSLPLKQCLSYAGLVCNSAGTCNNQTGVCSCNSIHQGLDCSLPYKQCPIYGGKECNNVGTCNNQTGICKCNNNYQGSDCSTPYKECPLYNGFICNSVGKCDNITGTCACNTPYSSDCSIINCPNDCTSLSQGTCNTSTGKCTCVSDFDGADCSKKKCPNNCSNSGTCNNGICKCNSNSQGSDCSIPYKECPLYNGFICNSVGKCDNTTGICTCSPPYSSDCSIINCPNDCTSPSQGTCNTSTGTCNCFSNYEGVDCSIKKCPNNCSNSGVCDNGVCNCNPGRALSDCSGYICPNNCSNLGVCSNSTGICQCDDIYSKSKDCSPIHCEDPNCSLNGNCNESIGECQCKINPYSFGGKNCEIPLHYLSSIEPSNESGGNATFWGWFGDIHDGLTLLIGNQKCYPILHVSNSSIQCQAQPGKGDHKVSIIQNSHYWNSTNILYRYLKSNLECPNNCTNSNQGECDSLSGFCKCLNNYSGADCNGLSTSGKDSSNELPNSETKIDENTGLTTIINEKTNYELYIESLVEIDILGNKVVTHPLQKSWSKSNQIENHLINTFTQTIENQCTINYKIEEIQGGDKEFSFAGKNFSVSDGSVKMSIIISGYQYKSNLNTLQLLMKSSVKTINNQNANENSCNDRDTEIETINTNGKNSLDIITIKKDSKILYGRFIDRLISDDKVTAMSTTIISKDNDSITVAMNIPHANHIIIDPDFSVILSTSFKSSCPSNNKSWLIPVSVTLPIVGCATLAGISLLVYKKNKESIFRKKIKDLSLQSKNL